MTPDDDAFIRTIVDSPGNYLPRLVYADWLDDRDDPRGPFLRAEVEWAAHGDGDTEKAKLEKKLRRCAKPLDAVWVYRVCRPPLGVCLRHQIFEFAGPQLALSDPLHGVPKDCPEYEAFLLNYNGGLLLDSLRNWRFECEGLARVERKKSGTVDSDLSDRRIATPTLLPTIGELGSTMFYYAYSFEGGDPIFSDCVPIGFMRVDFEQFNYLLLRPQKRRNKRVYDVIYYHNPLGHERDDSQQDDSAGFNEYDHISVVANSLTVFLRDLDSPPQD